TPIFLAPRAGTEIGVVDGDAIPEITPEPGRVRLSIGCVAAEMLWRRPGGGRSDRRGRQGGGGRGLDRRSGDVSRAVAAFQELDGDAPCQRTRARDILAAESVALAVRT